MKPGERFNPYRRFRNIYIPLGIAADANLSAAAKLTYGALARRAGPNGKCFPKHETLAADLGLTLRSLRRHLNELRLCALIEWERHGDHNEYFFLEHSTLEELPKKDSLGEQELPQVDTQELPSVDTLRAQELPQVDTPLLVTKREGSLKREKPMPVGHAPEFVSWYSDYPRKIGKRDAEKAYRRLTATQRKVLATNTPAWAEEFTTRPSDKIPYPATFIRKGAWEEPPPPTTGPRVRSGADEILEAMRHG